MHYDVGAMQAAGKRLSALREQFDQARALLGDGKGAATPFGSVDSDGAAHQALTGFHAQVHGEFEHAMTHLDQSAAALHQVAGGVEELDADNAHTVHHAAGKIEPAGVPPVSAPTEPDATERGNAWLDDVR
ncbi:hypothetical protein [Amycolatopsis sp. WQ 127309]|uniref:hypothetical protein n=1 Tax=Amycolatopsis sp. WQ 127309 TaxID=2932773 RepID=UPI001FF27D76|nr:hypothetical protein [Amycolatopsis sp. WQ 127309]UOZ06929.1 hypothetical protein MUY22_01140 [Amycolatopsis sp. WQ 127309]